MPDVYKYLNRTSNTITIGQYTIAPQQGVLSNSPIRELDRVDGTLVDVFVNQEPRSPQNPAEFNYYQPIISNEKGDGIKLDIINPVFGWHDLLSPTTIYEGAASNKPTFNTLVGGIRKYQFVVNDESFHEFHIPHDYAPGTDMYIHVHWTHNSGSVTGGSTTWGFEHTYAKGYSQMTFGTTKTISVTQAAATAALTHHIAEVKLTVTSGSATQQNSDLIETDGLLLVRTYLQANTTGVNPFMMFCDLHYQSTNLATKNKNFNFWT